MKSYHIFAKDPIPKSLKLKQDLASQFHLRAVYLVGLCAVGGTDSYKGSFIRALGQAALGGYGVSFSGDI